METLTNEKDVIKLEIPKDLITSKLVQKVMHLIKFRELTADNAMTKKQSLDLSEEILQHWWESNKDWFLKDLKR